MWVNSVGSCTLRWHRWPPSTMRCGLTASPSASRTLAPPPRPLKIVYAEIQATDTDTRGGEPVFDRDRCIGVVTSGAYGHRVRKSLAFACVPSQFAAPGAAFDVLIQGERRPAMVLEHAA